MKKVTGQKPSGVMRIKAGTTAFVQDYYVNFEEIGTRHPIFRCWHISEDYFLLQLYKNGAEDMIQNGKDADVSELAVFKAEDETIIPCYRFAWLMVSLAVSLMEKMVMLIWRLL